jgi:hypothetical protein
MSSLRCTVAVLALAVTLGSGIANSFPEATPGLLHAALLNGVQVDPDTGVFGVGTLQAVNLPEPPESGYQAGVDNPAQQLWALLKTREGTPVARVDFGAEKWKAPLWLLSCSKVTAAGADEAKLAPGEYVLDFHLASGKFYSFPFAVKLVAGKYLTYGDWNSWGYLLYAEGDPANALIWKIWLRLQETGGRAGVETKIVVVRDDTGKPFATSRPDTKQWLKDAWVRYEFDLIEPMQGTSGGGYLKGSDLLAHDGTYTLKMTVNGAAYGTWKLKVAGGRLVPSGRADRETATPLTFVYGGGDAFWYSSLAAAQADPGAMTPAERTFAQKGMIPDCTPITVGGTTLVPLGPIMRFLEAEGQWNAAAKTLTIKHGDRALKLTIGNATAQANGGPVQLGSAPLQRDGSTYAPARPVVEALGAELAWDAAKRLLIVIDGDRAGMVHVP